MLKIEFEVNRMFVFEFKFVYCYYGFLCRWSIVGFIVNGYKCRIYVKDV